MDNNLLQNQYENIIFEESELEEQKNIESEEEKDTLKRRGRNKNKKLSIKKYLSLKMIKEYGKYILLAIIFILAFQSIKLRVNLNYIPKLLGNTYLNVLSDSMVPEFKANDLVIGKVVKDTNSIKVGDIVTYKDNRILVTHRVVEVINNGEAFITKGDANEAQDFNQVLKEDIVSKYRFSIPYFGYAISKFQDFKFLAIMGVIFMYFIIKELIIEIKKVNQNKELKLNS